MKNLALTKKLTFVIIMVGITMPQLAVAEAKVGDRFGDWVYECVAIAENKTVCSISQTIMSKNESKRFVKLNLARNEKTKSIEFFTLLPLGIKLPSGATIAIDDGKAYQLTFKTCIPQGCVATYPVESGFIKTFQNGQKINISFTPDNSETPIKMVGSAKGLAEGVKAAGLN